MSFIRGGETVTIRRRSETSVDDFGNPVYSTTTITVKDALVAFGSTDEPVDAERNAIDSKITIYLPNGTTVQDGDIFIIRNTNWVQDGQYQSWVSPFTSFEAGTVVQLRKRIG
jgi:hypothetical protein